MKALIFLVIIIISAVVSIPMILYKVGWILSEIVVNDMFSKMSDDENEKEEEK
jgi:hypothetical protein